MPATKVGVSWQEPGWDRSVWSSPSDPVGHLYHMSNLYKWTSHVALSPKIYQITNIMTLNHVCLSERYILSAETDWPCTKTYSSSFPPPKKESKLWFLPSLIFFVPIQAGTEMGLFFFIRFLKNVFFMSYITLAHFVSSFMALCLLLYFSPGEL